MPAKKVHIPETLYNPHPGAIEKLTGATTSEPQTQPPAPSAKPEASITSSSQAETREQPTTSPTRNVKPTSFYLTPTQLRKLDDLAYTYNGRTGKRINRNDIIRHLVDTCDLGTLQGL